MEMRRILGVDPGTRFSGWGVVAGPPSSLQRLASGVLELGARSPIPARLARLHEGISAVLQEQQPDLVVVESAFFGLNASSALRLGEARGVVLLAAQQAGLALREVPPARVKRRVGGHGQASKEMLARMVAAHLGCEEDFSSLDESDALALAICAFLESPDEICQTHGSARGLPSGASEQLG